MKKLLKTFILFIFATNNILSQKKEITGIVIDSTKKGNQITVTINDTLNKLLKSNNSIDKILKDDSYVIKPNENGSFKIKCKESDSLYFASWRHITKSYKVSDLLKMKNIHIELEPEKCIEYVECNEANPKLYVFIGEKISVDLAPDVYYCNIISLDTEYQVKYKVIENIYGNYPKKTIDFTSYTHSSVLNFDKYQYVLLYVGEYCGKLEHIKYQYDPLYKTKDGKWASPCNSTTNTIVQSLKVLPEKIEFEKPIEYNYKKENIEKTKEKFTSPYFEITENKVVVKYGFYPEKLFEIKKLTSLKDFGFFK